MPLDSDTSNADANLIVEFYLNKRPPYEGREFVRVITPGDKTNIIDTLASEYYKKRFPRQWIHFQSQNDGSAFIGTPLNDWAKSSPTDISDYQLQELNILKFQTVEQVATMSDSQTQKVGMGGIGLRERARTFLQGKNQKASSSEVEELRAKHDAEMAEMREQMKALMAKFGDPCPAYEILDAPHVPKKRGRKPKLISAEA